LSISEDEGERTRAATYAGPPSADGGILDADDALFDDESDDTAEGLGDTADGLGDTADGLGDTADGLDDTAEGLDDTADGLGDTARSASSATKWGMAGLLLAYAGLGSYCLVSAVGHGMGPDHPQGVTRSVTTALGTSPAIPAARAPAVKAETGAPQGGAAVAAVTQSAATSNAIITGKAYAAKAFARVHAAPTTPKVEALSAVSATAIGPAGGNGDHPQIAPMVLDGNAATAWVTHWYASAHFGNLKDGTGLVLDMGRAVTIRRVQLALGGSPGLWGADIQIRVGNSPGQWNFTPAAMATDVGGWVAPELRTPVTGRYVQIWFTKLPRDSWGTYQEHVYGVTVHGSAPAGSGSTAASATPSASTPARATRHPGHAGIGYPGGGHSGGGPHPPGAAHAGHGARAGGGRGPGGHGGAGHGHDGRGGGPGHGDRDH
jgi:hypothetical protein